MALARGSSLQVARSYGVCVDRDGNILASSHSTHSVHMFRPDGSAVRTIGAKGSGPGQLLDPCGVTTDLDGNVLVADQNNHRVQVFKPDGTFVRSVGSKGSGAGQMMDGPRFVAVDGEGCIAVSDSGNN